MEKPTIITLGPSNVLPYLIKYVEVSQKKGTFNLAEADILKRCIDVSYRGLSDKEINGDQAIELLVQAIYKGQSHGDYTLNDSSLLFNIVNYINENKQALNDASKHKHLQQQEPSIESKPEEIEGSESDAGSDDFDLSELSNPVPLTPLEI